MGVLFIFTNCIKHSNATKLIINIKTDIQFIKLEISDNGSKVKPTENSGHYGLAFIQERAIELGGSFKVTNQGGFSIKVKLPISISR